MKTKYYLLIFIIFFIIIEYFFDNYITLKPFYKHNGYFKDNIRSITNFLTPNECKNITYKISQNKNIVENPLNEGFEHTRGILFEFDISNAKKELLSKNCDYLFDIFEKIRKPYANKFIMNALIIDNTRNHFVSKEKSTKMAVDYHYDTTLERIPPSYIWGIERSYLPECVSVIYIDIPESFQGGELDIQSYFYNLDIAKVRPEIGKLVEFDGKFLHGVHKMKDIYPKKSNRISIVLEQYSI